MVISHRLRQLQRQSYVIGLSALVTTAKQNGQKIPALHVVHSVSRAIMNTKLADTLANRLHVARITERQAAYPTRDFRLGSGSLQARHSDKRYTNRTSYTTMGDIGRVRGIRGSGARQIMPFTMWLGGDSVGTTLMGAVLP